MYDDTFSRFDTIPERDRRTARRTATCISLSRDNIAAELTRDKNG